MGVLEDGRLSKKTDWDANGGHNSGVIQTWAPSASSVPAHLPTSSHLPQCRRKGCYCLRIKLDIYHSNRGILCWREAWTSRTGKYQKNTRQNKHIFLFATHACTPEYNRNRSYLLERTGGHHKNVRGCGPTSQKVEKAGEEEEEEGRSYCTVLCWIVLWLQI